MREDSEIWNEQKKLNVLVSKVSFVPLSLLGFSSTKRGNFKLKSKVRDDVHHYIFM